MRKLGLIIGFSNQSRKRVFDSYNYHTSNYQGKIEMKKAPALISKDKNGIQEEIIEIIKLYPIVNTIYIVLKYGRIDLMKKLLSLIVSHFKHYTNNICLIVSDFQISQNRLDDQLLIKRDLQERFNLKYCFQYLFGKTYDLDSVYYNSEEFRGSEIVSHFNKTVCSSIMLDDKMMDLYPKINDDILQQIKELLTRRNQSQLLPLVSNSDQHDKRIKIVLKQRTSLSRNKLIPSQIRLEIDKKYIPIKVEQHQSQSQREGLDQEIQNFKFPYQSPSRSKIINIQLQDNQMWQEKKKKKRDYLQSLPQIKSQPNLLHRKIIL